MKSLQRRFNDFQKRQPNNSSFTSFANACLNGRFTRRVIATWFKKLVDPSDYNRKERNQLVTWLFYTSNPSTAEIDSKLPQESKITDVPSLSLVETVINVLGIK